MPHHHLQLLAASYQKRWAIRFGKWHLELHALNFGGVAGEDCYDFNK